MNLEGDKSDPSSLFEAEEFSKPTARPSEPRSSRLPARIFLVVVLALLVQAAAQARSVARELDQDIWSLQLADLVEISVLSATKSELRQIEVPQAVTVLTRADILRTPATNLPDLLRSLVGANVVRLQSSQTILGTRGSNAFSASRILILIDGYPIDPTVFSTTWWELVPLNLNDIQRIEFIRSPGTVYGANAQNGVVNIVTRTAEDSSAGTVFEVDVRAGEHSLLQVSTSAIGRKGETKYRWSIESSQIDPYTNPQRLEIVPGRLSPEGEQRFSDQGAQLDVLNFSGSLATSLGGNALHATAGYKRIASVQGRVPDRLCFVELDGFVGFLHADYVIEATKAKHTFSLTNNRTEFDFLRNNDSRSLLPAGMSMNKLSLGYESSFSARHHSLLVGVGGDIERTGNTTAVPLFAEQRVSGELVWSIYLRDTWSLSERNTLHLGGLVSDHYVAGSSISPMLALVHKVSSHTVLRAATYTSHRNPTVFEHSIDYAQRTGSSSKLTRIVANPTLEAERTVSYEVGVRVQPSERIYFSVDLFRLHVNDAIEWSLVGIDDEDGSPIYRSENTLDQEIQGLEAEIRGQLGRDWGLQVNATVTSIKNESRDAAHQNPNGLGEGRYGTDYVPPYVANAILDYDRGHIHARAHLQYTDAHIWQWPGFNSDSGSDSFSLKPVPSYTVLNASLTYSWSDRLSVSVEGLNLLDKLHTEWRGDKSYFGRTAWARLRMSL